MLTRIVKMTFEPENIPSFERLFKASEKEIRAFPGCVNVNLLQDIKDPSVFFTYSHWESEAALEAYRNSEFFKGVWGQTRTLFSERPKAWSLALRDLK
ncbi:putative quinol monooxygenase [Robiginitalea aurantiaca]|uniref:Antibiotic biosynthesis monooxygenase family protein n=1 Tax=Robiginitalea aurantiaca TaxID=3056915 RepID=A0ABT7WH23_9FLAO|nr:antibiotic biosynthesis monooxygenase family protein [Robiginitalea aurantiaca]MDM9632217.1 antibiotic biosynthesis monooxygenase family protein [Robiginitalea aurantiaca]